MMLDDDTPDDDGDWDLDGLLEMLDDAESSGDDGSETTAPAEAELQSEAAPDALVEAVQRGELPDER
jgi:hypothetical protein